MHFLNSYCWSSMGSISQSAKALFGRAKAKVHRTSWLLNALKRPSVVPKPRSTGPCGFSERWSVLRSCQNQGPPDLVASQCAKASFGRVKTKVHRTLWLIRTLKRPSVVSNPRSTGPCGFSVRWSTLRSCQCRGSPDLVASQCAKAPFGRAKAKVHRTLWHPSRL